MTVAVLSFLMLKHFGSGTVQDVWSRKLIIGEEIRERVSVGNNVFSGTANYITRRVHIHDGCILVPTPYSQLFNIM